MIGDREVVVDDIRVRGLGRASVDDDVTLLPARGLPTPRTVRLRDWVFSVRDTRSRGRDVSGAAGNEKVWCCDIVR